MDRDEPPCPSPYVSSSSIFKDISNFKTPKRPSYSLNFQSPCEKFFTASKQTPHSSAFRRRPSIAPPSSARTKKLAVAARKLKAFELEQSKSSRKAQLKKEQSLKSLAKSITVWLNFLFENPATCGCNLSIGGIQLGDKQSEAEATKGKRDSGPGISIGVDKAWRTPKRQRKMWSRAEVRVGNENELLELPNSLFPYLRESLEDVCSFDDLKQRMRVYLNLGSCKEIFQVMNQVTKTIDEGRLKLKQHCPIVTDLGLKNKATGILMCYNPIWLRIGLYIIFGVDSLLPNGDHHSEREITFLKMVIEKQFFSHAGLAKTYAYNKMVDGLYRPGYYENLGNVILKRILLLVITLDRIKSQSSLSIKYGIDGLDGGSPLLFKADSWIKSSGQVISEFLSSEIMHGEGNLLAHLVIIGYKVFHQQGPLVEYDFKVRDLFVDLQDGVKLCRAIQLLQHDSSILTKIVVPSDTYKKNLTNCGLALQYFKQAGVLLHDEDNMMIVAEDVANGDKELVLSLLWNIFVHLQLPLLVDKSSIQEEIGTIRGLGVDSINNANSSSLELLLNWIQAVCENYDCGIGNFDSLVDGKAFWCLLDYYFQKELHSSCLLKEVNTKSGKESIMSVNDYSDAVYNFILSQRLTTLLGNFPEVLQISDLLEYNGASSDRSVVILLVFLARQLFVKKNVDQLNFHKLLGCDCQNLYRKHLRMEQCLSDSEAVQKPDASDVHDNEDAARKFKAIQAWWQDMAERNQKSCMKPAAHRPIESSVNIRRETAAITIQSHFRRLVARRMFLQISNAVSLLQTVFRAWLEVRHESSFTSVQAISKRSETYRRYGMFFVQRHSFLKLKRSTLLIQQAVRSRLSWRHHQGCSILPYPTALDPVAAATIVQKFVRGWMARSRYNHMLDQKEKASYLYSQKVMFEVHTKAAIRIQLAWKRYMCCKSTQRHFYSTIIQSNFRRWRLRRIYLNQIQAVVRIQNYFRMSVSVKTFQQFKTAFKAAIVIQSVTRAWIARKEAYARRSRIISIQRHCRNWLARRAFMRQRGAALKIQSVILSLKYQKALNCRKDAVLQIQRFIRGHLSRNRLLGGASRQRAMIPSGRILRPVSYSSFQLELFLSSVLKLQRWWKGVLLHKLRTKSVIIIQSCTRGWIARRMATVLRHHVVVIQRHCRAWLARRDFMHQRGAALKIQSVILSLKYQKALNCRKDAVLQIQRFVRGHLSRNMLLGGSSRQRAMIPSGRISRPVGYSSLQLELFLCSVLKLQRWWKGVLLHKLRTKAVIIIQSCTRRWIARRMATVCRRQVVVIQRHCRTWLARRDFMRQKGAALKIQSVILSLKYQKALNCRKGAVLHIQRFIREHLSRNRLLGGASGQRAMIPSGDILRSVGYSSFQLQLFSSSVMKLQRWWKGVLSHKLITKSVIRIQSCTRGWIARRKATLRRHHVVVIQSHWKGFLARKESKEQLRDLRLRVKQSSRNVDDSKRLINRLLAALSELLHMKSVSGILHTCATLDMATEHSQRCCEELVAAGAIDKLLTLIRSVSRSIPDQEVLKHALSTLRNLARYPHLLELLIQSNGSIQTILWELLRNKEESYFIASELMMKISSIPRGVESLRKLPALVKRLHALVEELTRKAIYEKRNCRAPSAVIRENRERRLKEASVILKLITSA